MSESPSALKALTLASVFAYVLARAKEPSTWGSIAALSLALVPVLPPEAKILGTIAGFAGAVAGVLMRDRGAPPPQS